MSLGHAHRDVPRPFSSEILVRPWPDWPECFLRPCVDVGMGLLVLPLYRGGGSKLALARQVWGHALPFLVV